MDEWMSACMIVVVEYMGTAQMEWMAWEDINKYICIILHSLNLVKLAHHAHHIHPT